MESDSSALGFFGQYDGDGEDELVAVLAAYVAHNHGTAPPPRGSSTGRRPNVDRGAEDGHARLIRDYFADTPVYSARTFRRRFRMRRPLYLRIVEAVEANDYYFQQRPNATGKLGLSALQKCTAAIRQLAYGMPADAVDEYIRIAESTATKSLLRFCAAVIDVFSGEYLREPNSEDIRRLAEMHEERGFVGMLGSLDCMHWAWKKCPTAWAGQYTGKEEEPTIVLEAVVSRDLWFWHAFFGMPGSHNDINVLERSDLFSSFANAEAPRCSYTINGNTYDMGYFLADGIYPAWATLVQTIPVPRDNKEKYYAQKQEGARKDVERGFGVLQAQFAIVQGPGRFWSPADLSDIITACIILHNMIVEDERGENLPWDYDGASSQAGTQSTSTGFSRAFMATKRRYH